MKLTQTQFYLLAAAITIIFALIGGFIGRMKNDGTMKPMWMGVGIGAIAGIILAVILWFAYFKNNLEAEQRYIKKN